MNRSDEKPDVGGFRHVTMTYLAALAVIALLSLGTHFVADAIIAHEQATAKVVNVSGRQRMLSQRIAELSLELSRAAEPEQGEIAERLNGAMGLMAVSHQALIHGSAEMGISAERSPAIEAIYFGQPAGLDQRVTAYLALADSFLKLAPAQRANSAELKALLAAAHQPILAALDGAVKQYERDSETAIGHLRVTMLGMMILMLSALAAEALFIFRPLFARLREAQHRLLESAQTDPLTGCMNRRHILEMGAREFDRARRHTSPLAVMMFDIDHFKKVNDTWGHAAGDEAILTFTREILAGIRSTDLFGRIGGEEFVLVLPETTLDQAANVAEKLRARIAAAVVNHGDQTFAITVSIGVERPRIGDGALFDVMSRADGLLYKAKSAGRNRVMVGEDQSPVTPRPVIPEHR